MRRLARKIAWHIHAFVPSEAAACCLQGLILSIISNRKMIAKSVLDTVLPVMACRMQVSGLSWKRCASGAWEPECTPDFI